MKRKTILLFSLFLLFLTHCQPQEETTETTKEEPAIEKNHQEEAHPGDAAITEKDPEHTSDISCLAGEKEICGNHMDDNCDGQIDERCPWQVKMKGFFSNQGFALSAKGASIAYGRCNKGSCHIDKENLSCPQNELFTWIAGFSAYGKKEWVYTFPCHAQFLIHAAAIAEDQSIFLFAHLSNGQINTEKSELVIQTTPDRDSKWLIKFSSDGRFLWAKPLDPKIEAIEKATALYIHPTTKQIFLLDQYREQLTIQGQEIKSSNLQPSLFLAAFDEQGQVAWLRSFHERLPFATFHLANLLLTSEENSHLSAVTPRSSDGKQFDQYQYSFLSMDGQGKETSFFSFSAPSGVLSPPSLLSGQKNFWVAFHLDQKAEFLENIWTPHPFAVDVMFSSDAFFVEVDQQGKLLQHHQIGGDENDLLLSFVTTQEEAHLLIKTTYIAEPPRFAPLQPTWLSPSNTKETKEHRLIAVLSQKEKQFSALLSLENFLKEVQKKEGTQKLDHIELYGVKESLYLLHISDSQPLAKEETTSIWGRFAITP